ncbi:unannotated protein [freshwater metagenome]|uniref:Unannotated protein n=1 Tax=freshwater metagenome TaxID=449393 RepID=A0A6J7TD46_9ZZZZ
MLPDSHVPNGATFATGFQRSVALASLAGREVPIFVEQFVLECPVDYGATAFQTAWAAVLKRHPGLSAQYDFSGARLVYRQLPAWDGIRSFETANVPTATEAEAERVCADQYRAFSIGSDEPLWRVATIDVAGTWWLCVTLHHLIFDDRSWQIIRRDFAEALRNPGSVAPPPSAFVDFLARRATYVGIDGANRDRAVSEWKNLADGLEGPTALPSLAPFADHPGGHLGNRRFPVTLRSGFPERLRELLHDRSLTANSVGLAAWALVLSRLCRTDVVCFGQTRHGVPAELADAASIVGPMVDTLPFVVPVADDVSVNDFLADVALRHRRMYSLQPLEVSELLAGAFAPGTDDVMSTVVNHVRDADGFNDPASDLPIVRQRKSAALQPTLTVLEGEQVRFEIVTSARHAEFGRVAASALGSVLTQIVEQPLVLADISMTSQQGDQRAELRGPSRQFGATSLAELLETSLRANAERAALDGKERLTYAELDLASRSLAHNIGLTARTEQACVAVVAPPGKHAVIAVVAAIRSGHSFVCIDPARPPAEIQILLDLIGPDVVIDAAAQDAVGVPPPGPEPQPRRARPDDLAYLVATSGSTGVPKVVEIEQASAVNAICSLIETYGMTPDDRRLRSVSRPGADVFIAELLVPLCSGATLVEAIGDRPLAPAQFFSLLDREQITIAGAASSYLAELVESRVDRGAVPAPLTLRMMTTGTEAVDPNMVATWKRAFDGSITLLNVYGPAEATLVTTTCRLSELTVPIVGTVPIGLPLPNTTVMLLDRAGHPVPMGAVGEICVAGPGVMRGYCGLETSTIVPANPAHSAERYYRTGDLGRIGADGQLVFGGRSDRQVKIRGHRVELDGVEARLRAATGGSTVAAVVAQRAGRLVLFAAVESDGPVDDVGIRSRMAAGGSPAEVPAAVVGMARLPRLANGKLDRRTIAAEIAASLSSTSPATTRALTDELPSGPAAFELSAMLALWNELFEVNDCHALSDFFDLGGDSLLAIRLAAEVDVRFDLAMDLDLLYGLRRPGPLVSAIQERILSLAQHQVIRPINVSGRDARVYFMHGAHGETHQWSSIAARLADDFDSWGIAGRVAHSKPVSASVAEACAQYSQALVQHCLGEELVIVGFSASGVLAYETARLARAAGLPVRGIVLLETVPPDLPRAVRWLATASMIRRRRSTVAAAVWIVRSARHAGLGAFRPRRRRNQVPVAKRTNVPFIDFVEGHRIKRDRLRVTSVGTRDAVVLLDLRLVWGYITGRRVTGPVLNLPMHIQLLDEDRAPEVAAIIREFAHHQSGDRQ